MQRLISVLGPVKADVLGHFQVHEHIFARATPASKQNPALKIDDEACSLRELERYRAAGGGSIVDCQPGGAGRDAAALMRLSRMSGVNIVACTGYHLPNFYPSNHWIFATDMEGLRERFLSELLGAGIEGGGRAGAVKAAIANEGPEGHFALCLRAAAGAATRADVPLILHTERGIGAVKAIQLCEAEGLAPKQVIVCHADRQVEDWTPHEEIARTGAFLEYDTVARNKYHDDESERRLILHMLELGCEDRLLISMDSTAARLASYTPNAPGLDFLLHTFLPALQADGVPPEMVENIARRNPLRAFGLL